MPEWAYEAMLMRDLHLLCRKKNGCKWSLRDTAREFSEITSPAALSVHMQLADALRRYPSIKRQSTKEAAYRWLRRRRMAGRRNR